MNEGVTDGARPADDALDARGRLGGWQLRAVVASVVAAAIGYLGFTLWSGWRSVADALGQVGLGGVLVVLALSLANYGLRFLRWQAYLRAMDCPIPWRPSLQVYLGGFALTTTPGKAGEALRSVLLKPRGVPYPTSLAAIFSERLSDLVAVLVLTLFGLAAFPQARALLWFGVACVLAAFVVLANHHVLLRLQRAFAGRSRWQALLRHLVLVLLQARRCHAPGLLAFATATSVCAWAAEALGFWIVLAQIGLHVSGPIAAFIYAASLLAGAVSFMPGGLGGSEAAMFALLRWSGADTSQAVAATVLIRLATLWFAVVIGAVVLGAMNRNAPR